MIVISKANPFISNSQSSAPSPYFRCYLFSSFDFTMIRFRLKVVYNSIMNYQKRLIAIFRAFTEKIFVPQIRKIQGNLQDWNRFNALLSNETINYNELQIYVDSLPTINNQNLNDKKELPLYLRKRQQGANYVESFDVGFNPSKTFGGQKSKNIIIGIRQQQQGIDSKRQSSKDFIQIKEPILLKEDSHKKPTFNSMPNIGNPPQLNYQNQPVTYSLDRLLKQLLQNQQRIEGVESRMI